MKTTQDQVEIEVKVEMRVGQTMKWTGMISIPSMFLLWALKSQEI